MADLEGHNMVFMVPIEILLGCTFPKQLVRVQITDESFRVKKGDDNTAKQKITDTQKKSVNKTPKGNQK